MGSGLVGAWKRLPQPARRAAHLSLQAAWRALTPAMVRSRWRPGAPGGPPVLVAGLLSSSTGIGAGGRLFLEALLAAGVPACGLDVSRVVGAPGDLEATAPVGGAAPPRTLVSHLNPPELELMLRASFARVAQGRRHVGYWAWELPRAPDAWRRAFDFVDEVWTPSEFSAEALRALAPPRVPVRAVPHPVCAFPQPAPDRAGFGLPEGACLTLAAFDLKSTAARKNPKGVLAAYRAAVPEPGPDSALVCKVSGRAAEPELYAALRRELGTRPDVVLIDAALSQERMSALIASIDIVLSPHRAEGFGLVLAEAMRRGKAVVATGWSGNMDFMDGDCAALIRYSLTPAEDPQGMYGGGVWAEPDIGHAAELLAALIADQEARRALGERAAARIARQFEPAAWAAAVQARLGGDRSERRERA